MAELRVDPANLRAHATMLTGVPWPKLGELQVIAADAVPLAGDAASNLNDNARTLHEFQAAAETENERVAEMLNLAAAAYQKVDDDYKGKLDESNRLAAVDAITVPVPSTPMPTIPDNVGLLTVLSADYADVETTHGQLNNAEGGASAMVAAIQWSVMGDFAEAHAQKLEVAPEGWEGDAADAAYARMNAFSGWLREFGTAWKRLGAAAQKVAGAHTTAASGHTPIYFRYKVAEEIYRREQQKGPHGNPEVYRAALEEMQKCQQETDELRQQYAQGATFVAVNPSDPPFAQSSPGSTTVPEGNSTVGPVPSSNGSSGGAGSSGGSGSRAGSQMPPNGQTAPQQAKPSSDSPTAGQSGGGSPSGGGTPSGGQSGSGSPSGGGLPSGLGNKTTDRPKLEEPSLHPASADTGGGGAGGGGAGAGGGGAGAPLQPGVAAKTVGSTGAMGGTGAGGGAAPVGGAGAAMGGGGMPMGHGGGHGQGGGKERRRNPALTPDEDLYTEDREWTEAVIGNRRRKGVADDKDGS